MRCAKLIWCTACQHGVLICGLHCKKFTKHYNFTAIAISRQVLCRISANSKKFLLVRRNFSEFVEISPSSKKFLRVRRNFFEFEAISSSSKGFVGIIAVNYFRRETSIIDKNSPSSKKILRVRRKFFEIGRNSPSSMNFCELGEISHKYCRESYLP